MHYIRLMRPPSLDEKQRLKLVLTITTDLGDSFLCPGDPVPISVYFTLGPLADSDEEKNETVCLTPRKTGKSATFWKEGMRVLKLELPVPGKVSKSLKKTSGNTWRVPTICIVASHNYEDSPKAADIPFDSEGRILGLESEYPCLINRQQPFESVRRFTHAGGDFLRVDEMIGESIDRHVWDAGVVTTGVLLNLCQNGTTEHTWDRTPLLKELLCSVTPTRPLNVTELGCGVGILGLGLAAALYRRLSSSWDPEDPAQSPSSVLLTDLPDAEEVALRNIADETLMRWRSVLSGRSSVDTDFESLDWDEGKLGVFGPKAKASSWDLIIISDCTYNVDMLSALVRTISELHRLSMDRDGKSSRVMLATKPRHSSEKALFGLMEGDGWKILESASQRLPVLGLEDQTVEIYLFGKDAEQLTDGAAFTSSAPKRRKLR